MSARRSHASTEGQQLIFHITCTKISLFLLLYSQYNPDTHYTLTFNELYDTYTNNTFSQQHQQQPHTSITMSAAYEGQDLNTIAKQAERDLNSQGAKQEHRVDDTSRGATGASDSSKPRPQHHRLSSAH